jgi:hypothetical protein
MGDGGSPLCEDEDIKLRSGLIGLGSNEEGLCPEDDVYFLILTGWIWRRRVGWTGCKQKSKEN